MYKFTEEQIMIRDMVREFTKNEVAPYDKAMDETFSFNMEIYQQIYSKLVETGLMGIHAPIVKPANPELHAHQRLFSDFLSHHCKLLFSFGAEISCL